MSKFLHDDDNDDTKTTAILPVFYKNSQAKNHDGNAACRNYPII